MLVVNTSLAEALQESEHALGQPEQWFFSCTILSNLLTEQGQGQLAYLWKNLARQTELSPATYHILVGATYIQAEDWEQAIHHNKQAIAIDPTLAQAYSNLAKLYERLGQPETSLGYHYEFISLRPEQSSAEECETLGNRLLEQGQAANALSCYRQAIQNDPKRWSAYYRVAHLLTLAQHPDRAIRYYELLLERDPNQAEAHQKLGKLLNQQQRYDEALGHFRCAIAQKNDFLWAYLGLTQALLAKEQWEEVIDICEQALALTPEQPWPYRHMAKALQAQDRRTEAKRCWQKIAALEGWPEWGDRGYDFTYDPLTHKLSIWREQLQTGLKLGSRTTPLNLLQIGADQGMWGCWILDQILTHPGDRLTYLAQTFPAKLLSNLEKSGARDRTTCRHGNPLEYLHQQSAEQPACYDLIYIQPQFKNVESSAGLTLEISHLCSALLKCGGLLVFQQPAPGFSTAEQFLSRIQGQFQVSHPTKPLFLMKTG